MSFAPAVIPVSYGPMFDGGTMNSEVCKFVGFAKRVSDEWRTPPSKQETSSRDHSAGAGRGWFSGMTFINLGGGGRSSTFDNSSRTTVNHYHGDSGRSDRKGDKDNGGAVVVMIVAALATGAFAWWSARAAGAADDTGEKLKEIKHNIEQLKGYVNVFNGKPSPICGDVHNINKYAQAILINAQTASRRSAILKAAVAVCAAAVFFGALSETAALVTIGTAGAFTAGILMLVRAGYKGCERKNIMHANRVDQLYTSVFSTMKPTCIM
jgi:hypothetical protein